MNSPYIIEENQDFAVVYKPPRMHTAAKNQDFFREPHEDKSLTDSENKFETLIEWYMNQSKNTQYIKLLHRLDYETHGLALFARNEKSFHFLKTAQDNGDFIKEYSAICRLSFDESCFSATSDKTLHSSLSGFPQPPVFSANDLSREKPFVIESYFRPFGKGRKQVRPVIEDGKKHKETAKDKTDFYRTEIININKNTVTARIKRGFRHQIRCHLCWIGCPIENDPLYLQQSLPDTLALRAHAVFFPDPAFSSSKNGKKLDFRISPLQ